MFGQVVQGHVLDANIKDVAAKLKQYDSKLYVKWNPHKRDGQGTWEIRRQPEKKTALPVCKGFKELKYVEADMIHHVLDVCPLDYRVVDKIKSMDVWSQSHYGKDFGAELDEYDRKFREAQSEQTKEDLKYQLKQHRREWKDFQEYVLSGGNPAHILSGRWG